MLVPLGKFTMGSTMDLVANAMGSQLAALCEAAAKRGLDADERRWFLDLVDRATLMEGQRVRLVLASLSSEHLTQEQRDVIIAALTGVKPGTVALAAVEVKP
jgi:hypothetical protein